MSEAAAQRRNPLFTRGEYCDSKGRNYYFDNAKFILIFLVVMAHAISPMQNYIPAVSMLWRVCNVFHMPCMIFISGYFAKRYIRNGVINVQRPVTYAILYLAAQISVGAFEYLVLKNTVAPSILNARSSLWFLQCLVWWYLLLPILDRFEPKYVMAGVMLVGLFAGYDMKIGNFMAVSRMLVHMPFFMAGYYIKPEMIEKLYTKKAKLLSIPALLAVLLITFVTHGVSVGNVITCNVNFWEIFWNPQKIAGVSPLLWWAVRLACYVTAALMCFAFLVWVPRCKTFFTKFGSRTLQVYILHRFLYLAEQKYEWWKPLCSGKGAVLMILIALALTFILSLKPFSLPFDALQSIKVTKLLKKENTQRA